MRHSLRTILFGTIFLGLMACGSGGVPVPEGLEDEVEAANDPEQTFQVQFSADDAGGMRDRLDTVFPEITALAASGADGRDYMLQFFSGTPNFDDDITLLIYAEALRRMGDASVVSMLQEFLDENINGNLIWTPHFVTHTIKSLLGQTLEDSGYYTAQQMQDAVQGTSSFVTDLGALQAQTGGKPSCQKQYVLVDGSGNPLTYVDSNGQTRQAVVSGSEFESNSVPSSVSENYTSAVTNGDGTYLTIQENGVTYEGSPSKQFNCAGYAFRSFNNGQRWTSSPSKMFEVLVGAGELEEVPEGSAQADDIVFYFGPGAGPTDLPAHVAEVNRIESGLVSNSIIVRNADGQSGLFEAEIDAEYFKGNFFQTGRYPTHRIYRWKNGGPPTAIQDPSISGNGDYCGEEDSGDSGSGTGTGTGSGTATINVSISGVTFSPDLVLGTNDAASSGDITVNNVPTIVASENFTSLTNFSLFELFIDPRQVSGTGTFSIGTLESTFVSQVVQSALAFVTNDLKNADDNSSVFFESTSGTLTLSNYSETDGDQLTGSFSASVSGDRVTGLDSEGDPIEETITGSITGSFDVTIQ